MGEMEASKVLSHNGKAYERDAMLEMACNQGMNEGSSQRPRDVRLHWKMPLAMRQTIFDMKAQLGGGSLFLPHRRRELHMRARPMPSMLGLRLPNLVSRSSPELSASY